MLNTIVPKHVLRNKLPNDHYYYSFSSNNDMNSVDGYYQLYNKKSCHLIVELDSNDEIKAWLLCHQIYSLGILSGLSNIHPLQT